MKNAKQMNLRVNAGSQYNATFSNINNYSTESTTVLFFAKLLTYVVRCLELLFRMLESTFYLLVELAKTIRSNERVWGYFKIFMAVMIVIWYYDFRTSSDNMHQKYNKNQTVLSSIMPLSFDKENEMIKETNDAAPATVASLKKTNINDYILRFKSIAMTESAKYNIPASIIMAQGIIESHTGNSTLAVKNNNHFGLKCFSRNCIAGHCTNFSDDSHKDFFRKYDSPWASYRAHSQMIANGKYKVLQQYGSDYQKWAQGLKELGYATDKKYDKKLISIIEQYDLDKMD
jgi:flagellum-specific peptidoglycan hydrolase FlgJ